jgi:hypothetical protein
MGERASELSIRIVDIHVNVGGLLLRESEVPTYLLSHPPTVDCSKDDLNEHAADYCGFRRVSNIQPRGTSMLVLRPRSWALSWAGEVGGG